jgi:3-oxoadipate enol-lactonase
MSRTPQPATPLRTASSARQGRTVRGTAFEASGDGPPVLLIHGLGACREMWQWQVPALEPHFRVVRYDLLGHGESRPPATPCKMDEFVDQIAALLDELGIEKAAIVGFSLGGMIARAFAIAHPARVTALAIINSAHDRTAAERTAVRDRVRQTERGGPAATVDAAIERWFTPQFAKRAPEVIEQVRRWVMANDREIYPSIYWLLAEGDAPLVEAISAIRCPTLIMAAEDDRGNSPDMARRMAAKIPYARIAILSGLRHMALAEDPAAVNAELVAFLDDALRAARPGQSRPSEERSLPWPR